MTPPGNGHSAEEDQLKIILKTLGSQDASDLSFITDPDVMNHLLTEKPHQPKVDFKKKYKHSNMELLQIMTNMLEFNPHFRKSPREILKMDIFSNLRAEYP